MAESARRRSGRDPRINRNGAVRSDGELDATTLGATDPPSTSSGDAAMVVERMDSSSEQPEEPPHRCVRSRGSAATLIPRADKVNGLPHDKGHTTC
jgi:hypothetical protein